MDWTEHFKLQYATHLANLKTLSRPGLVFEYKQLFYSRPVGKEVHLRTAIALKRAADSCRRTHVRVPADVLAILSLKKER